MKIHELVTPFIQKTTGLLLKHQPDSKSRQILAKVSDNARLSVIDIKPLFPDCKFLSS